MNSTYSSQIFRKYSILDFVGDKTLDLFPLFSTNFHQVEDSHSISDTKKYDSNIKGEDLLIRTINNIFQASNNVKL